MGREEQQPRVSANQISTALNRPIANQYARHRSQLILSNWMHLVILMLGWRGWQRTLTWMPARPFLGEILEFNASLDRKG